jgi:hypothetical protein
MLRNPFSRRSQLDLARDRAEQLLTALRSAAESVRDQADKVLDELPEQDRGRRPVVAGAIIAGGAAATAVAIRKLLGADRDATRAPSAPTAPAGPTDPALNDPALKAKVESELFQQDEAADKARISVDVADGVVTLRGELGDAEAITSVVESATVIGGVRRVENLLHLPGEEPASVTRD